MTLARDKALSDERWFERTEILQNARCPFCKRQLSYTRGKRGRYPTYCNRSCKEKQARARTRGF